MLNKFSIAIRHLLAIEQLCTPAQSSNWFLSPSSFLLACPLNLFSLDSALTYRVPFATINFFSQLHFIFISFSFFFSFLNIECLTRFCFFSSCCCLVVVESKSLSVCLICLKLRQQHFMHVSKLETICDLLAHDLII